MKLIECFISLITFPIKWFWKRYEIYKENENIPKLILLFIVSLSGVLLLGIATVNLIYYLLEYHLNLLIVLGIIFWLYAYIRDRNPKQKADTAPSIQTDLEVQAEKGYPIMRNIIFQTAKAAAPDIGSKIPRLLGEIEMPESRFILRDNLCFYQFRLMKEDMAVQYSENDLNEFKSIFQANLSHKIESGAFPSLKMEKYRDQYGNFHDSIIIDTIEDIGNMLILNAVFSSREYAEYRHQIEISKDTFDGRKNNISTSWEDKP